jgi:protein-S-isoprenylcysteine O-methyltransferase Ste14
VQYEFFNGVVTIAVVLCWPFYISLFLHKRSTTTPSVREDRRSKIGILLQYGGALLMWLFKRPLFSPLFDIGFPATVMVPAMAVVLAAGSLWFSMLSLRVLGAQWRFVASVESGHKLIREGPYGVVRHPLYLCFFAFSLATGMVWTSETWLPLALAVFIIGMWIRVRTEERILLGAFGEEYRRYCREVPALIPRL